MRFIKKLVILTGGDAKGTLMLEKNSFGVWGKLNLFGYTVKEGDRLAVFSGGNMFVSRLNPHSTGATFRLGELDFDAVHAAVVGERVALYGSNCAKKLSFDFITDKVAGEARKLREREEQFVKYSGGKCDFFKEIAPPQYNDFAIAEKNYFPAYLSVMTDAERDDEEEEEEEIAENSEANAPKEEKMTKLMPYELERRYIRLMEVAASVAVEKNSGVDKESEEVEGVFVADIPPAEDETVREGVNISDFDPDPPSEEKANAAEVPSKTQGEFAVGTKDFKSLRDLKDDNAVSGRKATYFERSSAQLEKLLAENERFAPIERLIPGGKFVKINYDGQRYYLVGVIGSDYICYGVPARFTETPPRPLDGYARWLPFDPSDPKGEGFWMMYQDGVSGETLKSGPSV